MRARAAAVKAAGRPLPLPRPLADAKGVRLRVCIAVKAVFFFDVAVGAVRLTSRALAVTTFGAEHFGGGGLDPTLVDLPTPVIVSQVRSESFHLIEY